MRYRPLATDALCPLPTEAYALGPREHLMLLRKAIAVLKKVRYALCPMPYAQSYLMLLRKAI